MIIYFISENSCANKNGGCSQICEASPAGPKCKCNSGYELQSNGKTCKGNVLH